MRLRWVSQVRKRKPATTMRMAMSMTGTAARPFKPSVLRCDHARQPLRALPLVRGDVHLVAQGERDIVETFEQAGAREVVDLERWPNARRLDDATLDVDGDLGRRIGARKWQRAASDAADSLHQRRSDGRAKCPAIAVAAATAGETKCVRPPGP